MKRKGFTKDIFLSLFYSGYFPFAPGTAGSALAVALGAPIVYFSRESIFLLAIFIALVAIKHINIYEAKAKIHDDRSIVIDELVGVWIAMAFIGFEGLSVKGAIQLGLAFILFRIFDVWKPSLIGRIDREVKGGLGVVGDDALAGVVAGICGVIALYALDSIKIYFGL